MIFLLWISDGQGRRRYIQFKETKTYNVVQGKHTGPRGSKRALFIPGWIQEFHSTCRCEEWAMDGGMDVEGNQIHCTMDIGQVMDGTTSGWIWIKESCCTGNVLYRGIDNAPQIWWMDEWQFYTCSRWVTTDRGSIIYRAKCCNLIHQNDVLTWVRNRRYALWECVLYLHLSYVYQGYI